MRFNSKFQTLLAAFIFFILYNCSDAIALYSDTLKFYCNIFSNANSYQNRKTISEKIYQSIIKSSEDLSIDKVDSLGIITVLKSEDKKLIIFSWENATDSGSFDYYCTAVVKTKNGFYFQKFIDKSFEFKSPEFAASTPIKWYGAHYYQLVEKRYQNKILYTCIGIDWKSVLSKKKVIEVFSIDTKGNIICGEPVIQRDKKLLRRLILEYKFDISISCRYNYNSKMIVFDHLIPPNQALKNQKQFYVNDLSFDALKFEKGKWNYIEDIDARNIKSKEDDNYSAPK